MAPFRQVAETDGRESVMIHHQEKAHAYVQNMTWKLSSPNRRKTSVLIGNNGFDVDFFLLDIYSLLYFTFFLFFSLSLFLSFSPHFSIRLSISYLFFPFFQLVFFNSLTCFLLFLCF